MHNTTPHETLDRRQQRILRFVIDQFVESGHPVGSRSLSKLKDEHLSPASIRNTMSDLEEMGFLQQPHTSAGRIPTDQGYRHYVDSLISPTSIPHAEQDQIREVFSHFGGMFSSILECASRVLSQYSHYIGIASKPRFDSMVFRHIQFIRQGPGRILVIFVSSSGLVYNKVIEVEGSYEQEYLEKVSRWVIDHFMGKTLLRVRQLVQDMLQEERARYDILAKQALKISQASFEDDFGTEEGLIVEGTSNLAKEPDFATRETMERLLDAIEEKNALLDLISGCQEDEGVQVVIGSESELMEIQGCSLIASAYNFPDGSRGSIAVLGPKRMPYPRTIYLVDYISRQISKLEG